MDTESIKLSKMDPANRTATFSTMSKGDVCRTGMMKKGLDNRGWTIGAGKDKTMNRYRRDLNKR
jgi:hypothetical protein